MTGVIAPPAHRGGALAITLALALAPVSAQTAGAQTAGAQTAEPPTAVGPSPAMPSGAPGDPAGAPAARAPEPPPPLPPEDTDGQAAPTITLPYQSVLIQPVLGEPGLPSADARLFGGGGIRGIQRLGRFIGAADATGTLGMARALGMRRRGYAPVGLSLGGLNLFPGAELGTTYSTNVLRQTPGFGDAFATAHLEALGQTDWSRHQVMLSGELDQRIFARHGQEDTTSYALEAGGRIDLPDAVRLAVLGGHRRDFVNRRSVLTETEPRAPIVTLEDEAEASLTADFGPLTLAGGVAYGRKTFRDGLAPDGRPVDYGYLDRRRWAGTAEAAYAVGGTRALLVSLSHDRVRFDEVSALRRDFDRTEALAGLSGDVTPLLKGRITAGYSTITFPGGGAPSHAAIANVQLIYLVTELTTLSLLADRRLETVDNRASRGAYVTRIGVQADHELLRHLTLNAQASYQVADYLDTPVVSRAWRAALGGRWMLDSQFYARGTLAYSTFRSSSPLLPRTSNTLETTLSLGVQF